MCGVCGCGEDAGTMAVHRHGPGSHRHAHPSEPVPAAGTGTGRLRRIEQDILAGNDRLAAGNRARLDAAGVLALNLVSGPGAGKTALLAATVAALGRHRRVAVIEGDQATDNDARRIRRAGAPAVQINTGRGCHLDARMIAHALDGHALDGHALDGHALDGHALDGHALDGHALDGHALDGHALDGHALDGLTLERGGILFIENVGNLVCPAAFDLGEHRRVALLAVTDGEDKPVKYPDMFAGADLMIVNKVDLLPHVDFDPARCLDHARSVNPGIACLPLSARRGDGMTAWLDWIEGARRGVAGEAPDPVPARAHA